MLTHELARGITHRRTAHRADIEIVEHDDVNAPVERLAVGARVARDCPPLDDDLLRLLDGNVHERKRIDLLRLAVFENCKIVARQARDELALLVGDHDVDVDVVHLDLERDAGWLRSLSQKDGRLQGNGNEEGKRGVSHLWRNLSIYGWNCVVRQGEITLHSIQVFGHLFGSLDSMKSLDDRQ